MRGRIYYISCGPLEFGLGEEARVCVCLSDRKAVACNARADKMGRGARREISRPTVFE